MSEIRHDWLDDWKLVNNNTFKMTMKAKQEVEVGRPNF